MWSSRVFRAWPDRSHKDGGRKKVVRRQPFLPDVTVVSAPPVDLSWWETQAAQFGTVPLYVTVHLTRVIPPSTAAATEKDPSLATLLSVPATSKDTIPLRQLYDDIKSNHDTIVNRIAGNLQKLLHWKDERLSELQTDTSRLVDDWLRQSKEREFNAETRRNEFPLLDRYQRLLDRIKTIRDMIADRLTVLARVEQTGGSPLQEQLMDVIVNRQRGILSIQGDARQELREQMARAIYSLKYGWVQFGDFYNNYLLMGGPGVGKTTAARMIAYVLAHIGVLTQSTVTEVTKADLISGFVGRSGPQTIGVLIQALDGVLFIDEAYELGCTDGRFESESVTELINWMDKKRGLYVIIAAGYEDKMRKCFLTLNPGMPRRFNRQTRMTAYPLSELTASLLRMIQKQLPGFSFTPDERAYVFHVMQQLQTALPTVFANQLGDMENLASYFLEHYFGGYRHRWQNGKFDNNRLILDNMFIDLLENKGYRLQIEPTAGRRPSSDLASDLKGAQVGPFGSPANIPTTRRTARSQSRSTSPSSEGGQYFGGFAQKPQRRPGRHGRHRPWIASLPSVSSLPSHPSRHSHHLQWSPDLRSVRHRSPRASHRHRESEFRLHVAEHHDADKPQQRRKMVATPVVARRSVESTSATRSPEPDGQQDRGVV